MIRPSRGWRESIATMRKYGRCLRPNIFMRIRTATFPPKSFGCILRSLTRVGRPTPARLLSSFISPLLFAFSLAVLGSFLGGFAMAGIAFFHHEVGTGLEGSHLAQPGDHLDALPNAHLGHLPHHNAHLLEMVDELFDFVRLGAAAGGNAATPANVDKVRIPSLVFGHGVNHPLEAANTLLRVLPVGHDFAH